MAFPPYHLAAIARSNRIGRIIAALAFALALSGAPAPAAAQVSTADTVLGTSALERGIDQGELPDISAPHAMVLGQDGMAYFERGADDPIKIASVTKVMTALVALEYCELADIVTVNHAAATVGEASLGLREGDTLTMADALTGLMVMSGNDAATAIAATAGAKIGPTSDDPYAVFIDTMNRKAVELGCGGTVFENPHGLDFGIWEGGMHSTVRDIAAIFAAAMEREDFRTINDSARTSIPVTSADGHERTLELTVRNEIHGQGGNIGGKTGTTPEAGHCFMGAFEREGGGEVYVAVFGAQTNEARFSDTLALADWYYGHIAAVPFVHTRTQRNGIPIMAEVPCRAWCDRAVDAAIEDASATVSLFSLGDELAQEMELAALDGPVEVGDAVGTILFRQGDGDVGSAKLIAAESVPAPNPFEWLMIRFDRAVRLFEGRPCQAEERVLNEAPDPLDYDSWGTAA